MVREVDSTSPPDPRCPIREVWQRSPPILPSQPRRYPRRGFWYLANFRHGTRLVSPKFSGRGIGARQPGCRALAIGCSAVTQRSPLVRSFGRALPRRSVRRVPAGRPQLPRDLRQFLRPTEVVDGRVREHVRNSGALLNREFAALAALDLLQQRLLDQVGTAARQRALALAVASLFLGGGKGHTVTLPLPTPLRQPLWPRHGGLDFIGR